MAQDLSPVPLKAPLVDQSGILTLIWSDWMRLLRELTIGLRVTIITDDYTASLSDDVILCDATTSPLTITLPGADSRKGKSFTIKKVDSSGNAVTVAANAIDGASTRSLSSQFDLLNVVSDGDEDYFIVGAL